MLECVTSRLDHGGEHIHANLESSGVVTARAANSTSPLPKSDLSDFGQSKRPNSGKPEFGWGEVGARSAPGEGGRISRIDPAPLTPTLSPNGERECTELAAPP